MKDLHPHRMAGRHGHERISLGLAISGALLKPGETRTTSEIAAFCDCRRQNIDQIERRAIIKLRRALKIKVP